MQNKVVARYQDGRLIKGVTHDFLPNKPTFHIVPVDAAVGSKPLDISVQELKAVFFVKDYAGDAQYQDKKDFDKPAPGRKIRVEFKDGELVVGTTQGYQAGRPGFFVIPADPQSNIDRCYVVSAAARSISFI
jgi:hypothetical protein